MAKEAHLWIENAHPTIFVPWAGAQGRRKIAAEACTRGFNATLYGSHIFVVYNINGFSSPPYIFRFNNTKVFRQTDGNKTIYNFQIRSLNANFDLIGSMLSSLSFERYSMSE